MGREDSSEVGMAGGSGGGGRRRIMAKGRLSVSAVVSNKKCAQMSSGVA